MSTLPPSPAQDGIWVYRCHLYLWSIEGGKGEWMEGFTVSLAGPHEGDVGLNLAVSAWHVLSLA